MARETELGPYAAFGDWLKDRRGKVKHLSQLDGSRQARAIGLSKITQGKLSHIERGWNSNPDADYPFHKTLP